MLKYFKKILCLLILGGFGGFFGVGLFWVFFVFVWFWGGVVGFAVIVVFVWGCFVLILRTWGNEPQLMSIVLRIHHWSPKVNSVQLSQAVPPIPVLPSRRYGTRWKLQNVTGVLVVNRT